MKLIVGLGNPGEKYEKTRHNIGFMVLDKLAGDFNFLWQVDKKSNSLFIKNKISGQEIILAKPQTMMNASGFSASHFANFYQTKNEDIWIVHDDLDLALGKIKIGKGHGAAGHHGVESIVEKLGCQEFVRFRLGIGHPLRREGHPGEDDKVDKKIKYNEVQDYVLKNFEGKEAVEADKMIKKTVEIISSAIENGLEKAISRFNLK